MSQQNPCLHCGACCASFRVSFYWGETSAITPTGVPVELTTPVNQFYSCMNGTDSKTPRCTALTGVVGDSVSCTIYQQRSSTCREFDVRDDDGNINPQCTKARAKHGLLPVVLIDEMTPH
jgi:Fe-S-cluster containining protein